MLLNITTWEYFKLPLDFTDSVSLYVLSSNLFSWSLYDVLNMKFCVVKDLFVIVLGILLSAQYSSLLLRVSVFMTDLTRRPQLSFRNIWVGASEFDLKLIWVAKLQKWLYYLLIKKVDLSHCFFLEKFFNDAPQKRNRARNSCNIAYKHSWTIRIWKKRETFLHRANKWKQPSMCSIYNDHPVLHLPRDK